MFLVMFISQCVPQRARIYDLLKMYENEIAWLAGCCSLFKVYFKGFKGCCNPLEFDAAMQEIIPRSTTKQKLRVTMFKSHIICGSLPARRIMI